MIVELILVAVIAFVIGYSVNQYINLLTIKMLLNDLGITPAQLRDVAAKKGIEVPELEEEQDADALVVEIRVERINDQLLAYDHHDRFVTQSTDEEVLLTQIVEHYPAGTRVRIQRGEHTEKMLTALARQKG
jgi:hypothetical protein